eukprot:1076505-Amorphochlora_amoeboformis.AAC.1
MYIRSSALCSVVLCPTSFPPSLSLKFAGLGGSEILDSDGLDSDGLGSDGLSSDGLNSMGLGSVGLGAEGSASVRLDSVGLDSVGLDSVGLDSEGSDKVFGDLGSESMCSDGSWDLGSDGCVSGGRSPRIIVIVSLGG